MERVLMKGCEAIAEAAVRAGCRFFAGYPITPQNEIPEYFSRRLPEVGGAFVQGESEVASINMVYGAASTGVRAMTSSSSPGIALKSEGIAYCAAARLPMVYVNVSRGGPAIGVIQPAQNDYLQATRASGNGGFRMRVFAPSTVQEAVDMTYAAFDYADQDRNPVLILTDGIVGSVLEPVVLPEMKTDEEIAALRAKGVKAGLLRPMTIYPFPYKAYDEINYDICKGILDIEMSIPALFIEDVRIAVKDRAQIHTYLRSGGNMLSKKAIVEKAEAIANGQEVQR